MPQAEYLDPYRAYNFKLVLGEKPVGHFTECHGLDVKVEAITYREGGAGPSVRQLPGRVAYGEVTLRYGLSPETAELWDWVLTGVKGNVQRKNVSIVLLDNGGGSPVMQWNLLGAWVTQWRGASLNAAGQEVAIEEMALVYEDLERA